MEKNLNFNEMIFTKDLCELYKLANHLCFFLSKKNNMK